MYHIFFIHLSVDGHLGCFHDLAIVNSAAMNIVVHVSLWIMVFSGYMPSSGIAGSYGNSIFSFLKQRNLLSCSSGGWKFQIKVQQDLTPGEGFSLACRWPPFLCVLTWPFLGMCGQKERVSPLVSPLRRMLIPMDEGPTLMISFNLNYFLRGLISKYNHTGVRASTFKFCRNTFSP